MAFIKDDSNGIHEDVSDITGQSHEGVTKNGKAID